MHGDPASDRCVMRFNNLVSFTGSAVCAEEFGDWLVEVTVPATKVLLHPGLRSAPVLNSENEYIVIGGNYTGQMWHRYG